MCGVWVLYKLSDVAKNIYYNNLLQVLFTDNYVNANQDGSIWLIYITYVLVVFGVRQHGELNLTCTKEIPDRKS